MSQFSKFFGELSLWKRVGVGLAVLMTLVALGFVIFLDFEMRDMSPSDVAVVDAKGKILSEPLSHQLTASVELLEIKKRWEKEFEKRLESLLSKVVGAGKAVVRVNVTLNAQNRDTLQEVVDPDSVVLTGRTKSIEMSSGGRTPSTEVGHGEKDRGNLDVQKELVTVNNDLSRTTTKIREVAGGVERVSVAVLVDGVRRSVDGAGEEWVPRSSEELTQLENLVKNAIGFTVARGDSVKIESIRFQKDNMAETKQLLMSMEKRELRHSLFKWSLLGFSLILFLFIVIRPFMSWMAGQSMELSSGVSEVMVEDSEELQTEERVEVIEPMDSEKVESERLRNQIVGLLDRDGEKAADALSMWLTGKE